jgi:hypothetical protein
MLMTLGLLGDVDSASFSCGWIAGFVLREANTDIFKLNSPPCLSITCRLKEANLSDGSFVCFIDTGRKDYV